MKFGWTAAAAPRQLATIEYSVLEDSYEFATNQPYTVYSSLEYALEYVRHREGAGHIGDRQDDRDEMRPAATAGGCPAVPAPAACSCPEAP